MSTASNALARLIDRTKEANEWSDMDLVNRARRAGHQMSKSTISDVRTAGVATVVPDKVRALADALDVPVADVVRASLEAAGLPAGEPSLSPEQAIRRDVTLPIQTKRALLALLKDARRWLDKDDSLEAQALRRDLDQHAYQQDDLSFIGRHVLPQLDHEALNADPNEPDHVLAQRRYQQAKADGRPMAASRGQKMADAEPEDVVRDEEGPEEGA